MTGNIVGEEFKEYVFKQIGQRQKDQYSGYDQDRTPEQIQYLNNQTAWVKLASGMEIVKEDGGLERLARVIGDPTLVNQFRGTELAEKTILFNGTSRLNREIINESYDDEGNPIYGEDNFQKGKGLGYTSRSGYNKTKSIWNFNSVYGLGGTDFGQQPMPGITSVTIKSLNRGSIREANVQIKAYNKYQFALLELLYLRIGFTMMLEWGNDKYIDNDGNFKSMENTIIEDLWFNTNDTTQLSMINTIEEYRIKYHGNYDGFFGKVVNFTWTFGSDGSYDIDLKLITVGDVVESIQANIPVSAADIDNVQIEITSSIDNNELLGFKNLIDTPIVNSAQDNKLGRYLFTTIGLDDLFKNDSRYFSSYSAAATIGSQKQSKGKTKIDRDTLKSNNKYFYYMSFGELLELVQNNLIQGIKTGDFISPQLNIENDVFANKVSYFPNQISLDPRVCIFKPVFGDLGEDNPRFRINGITTPESLENDLESYVSFTPSGVLYGRLMNIYLNYDFISSSLIANTTDGKLSVFKFFKRICDGINSALGGVNHIEPVIKEDKIVTFIDQNPISGYLEDIADPKVEVVDLEVYGYNSSKKESNFVKDISFKTSITPDLASMISIGTTAGGSTTKVEDGTAFSYWNEGLRDRFSPAIIDPQDTMTKEDKEEKELQKRADALAKIWNQKSSWVAFSGTDKSSDNRFKSFEKSEYGRDNRSIKHESIRGNMSIKEFVNRTLKNDRHLAANDDLISQSELSAEQNNNYAVYLADAFGGGTEVKVQTWIWKPNRRENGERKSAGWVLAEKKYKVNPSKANYFKYDSSFISRGKAAFRTYINTITKEIYDTPDIDNPEDKSNRSPSSQIGFIPVGFNITLEGISGIKIYNKLNINNTFLPDQYPKALKFLIQKVDHKIQDNTWETDLDTLSIPNTKKIVKGNVGNLYSEIQKTQTGLLPESERGPQPDDTKELVIKIRRKELLGYKEPTEEEIKEVAFEKYPVKDKNSRARDTNEYARRQYIRSLKASGFGKQYIVVNSSKVIEALNPDAKPAFRKFFNYLEENYKGYTLRINDVGRSIEESKNLNKKNSSNADPGRSKHNYYASIDMNVDTPSGKSLMKDNNVPWINHGFDKAATQNGLVWGGTFAGYVDSVHFALDFNINVAVENATAKYGALTNMKGDDGRKVKLT